jgi:hypothetical protein
MLGNDGGVKSQGLGMFEVRATCRESPEESVGWLQRRSLGHQQSAGSGMKGQQPALEVTRQRVK